MPVTPYTRTKAGLTQSDFVTGLRKVVDGAGLGQPLVGISFVAPDQVTFRFDDALSEGDQTTLTDTIAAYTPNTISTASTVGSLRDAAFRRAFYFYNPDLKALLAQHTTYDGTSATQQVAAFLAQFDEVVLDKDIVLNGTRPVGWPGGTGVVINPAGAYGVFADAVITAALALNPSMKFYGYVPGGQGAPSEGPPPIFNFTAGEIEDVVDAFVSIGCTGMILDQAGGEFGCTRVIQNAFMAYCRSLGVSYILNAWFVDHVFSDQPDAAYAGFNPGSVPTIFGDGGAPAGVEEAYLLESWVCNTQVSDQAYAYSAGFLNFRAVRAGTPSIQGTRERLLLALAGRAAKPKTRLMGLTFIGNDPKLQAHYTAAELLTVMARLDSWACHATLNDTSPMSFESINWTDELGLIPLRDRDGCLADDYTELETVTNIWGTATGFRRKFGRESAYWHCDCATGEFAFTFGDKRVELGGDIFASRGADTLAPVDGVITGNVDLTKENVSNLFDDIGKVANPNEGVTYAVLGSTLLVGQSAPAQNGPYFIVQAQNGTMQLQRRGDFYYGRTRVNGVRIPITGGAYAGKVFICTATASARVGADALSFALEEAVTPYSIVEKGHAGAWIATTAETYAAQPGTHNPFPGVGFANGADQDAFLILPMRSEWNQGAFKFDFSWTTNGGTGTPAQEVDWEVNAGIRLDGDAIDAAFVEAAATVSSVYTADGARHSASVTVTDLDGTPDTTQAAVLVIRLRRKGTADNLADIARLVTWMIRANAKSV